MTPTPLARRMRERMDELGLTQQEVADGAGISQAMVGYLLNGKRAETSKIVELSQVLMCDADWLAGLRSGSPNLSVQDLTAEQIISAVKMCRGKLSAEALADLHYRLVSVLLDQGNQK